MKNENHNLPIFRDNVVCPKCKKRTNVEVCPEAGQTTFKCNYCFRSNEWKPSAEFIKRCPQY